VRGEEGGERERGVDRPARAPSRARRRALLGMRGEEAKGRERERGVEPRAAPTLVALSSPVPPLAPPLGYAKGDSPWALDEAARTVTVLGGVGTRNLLDWLNQCTKGASPNGWTLPAFSWYTDQTIAGAVSTATHGSSLQHGSLSQQVVSAQVVLADGTVRDFSGSDPLFVAVATSVGRLGVIVQLTMQVTESVPVRRTTVKVPFAQMVEEVTAVQDAYVAAMAASGNNPADPAVVAALAPVRGSGGERGGGRRGAHDLITHHLPHPLLLPVSSWMKRSTFP
jgi:FAD/FMN-containing dehydrogenase